MTTSRWPLLEKIDYPSDLRQLTPAQLPQLCKELRAYLLETVSQTGGHLASGLGVVELTVALHYVFDTPEDSLIWDVGHQAYPHKILTGRRQKMHTLKQLGGLSGFPCQAESVYDDFGVGHSSTSISAALGMAMAEQVAGRQGNHVAIIGDGAMTAGMAFEALHHAASLSANMLVVLNDNDMSISPNVGGLSKYFSHNLVSGLYQRTCRYLERVVNPFPMLLSALQRAENCFKSLKDNVNLFEDIGFDYTGPCNGHDVLALVNRLETLKNQPGPKLLHIKTVKGKGYEKAEQSPITYHGVSSFDVQQGVNPKAIKYPAFTQIFSDWLIETAQQDERLLGVTPAMREGSGLIEFSKQFPSRYFDVAIAEQHAVTLAAGMACRGAKPVVAIYSTFLQRAYDQLIHDVALQNLDVLFAVDRAGIVGEDGATHAGIFDLVFCRVIPNLVIMTPSNEYELFQLLNTGYHFSGPALVRYPKSQSVLPEKPDYTDATVPLGKAKVVTRGNRVAILVFGILLSRLTDYAESHNATLVDMRFVKPLDTDLIRLLLDNHQVIITVEEGCVSGGAGEAVSQFVMQKKHTINVLCLGISDTFVCHGKRDEILAMQGLDKDSLHQRIDAFLQSVTE